jgi:NADPH2:quinone reductase
MLEVIVHPLPELRTETREVSIPVPGPDEVLIRVAVAGSNVKGISHCSFREYH